MFVHQNVWTLHFFIERGQEFIIYHEHKKRQDSLKLERIENDLVLDFKHVVHPGRYQFMQKIQILVIFQQEISLLH